MQNILSIFNKTDADFPDELLLHQLFEKQVKITPENDAVVCDHSLFLNKYNSLNYKQLNNFSNSLAQLLREKGAGPDKVIGIISERSIEMIVGIFAILKAGSAYLPLSPNNPEARNVYMLKDSSVDILLLQSRKLDKINFEGTKIYLEDESSHNHDRKNLPIICTSRNLAYVIYTSGSTGKPKGVMVEHRAVVNRLNWMQKKYPINENDTLMQKTPYYFDVSVWELFWWSLCGARLCLLMPGGEKLPVAIISTAEKHQVSVIHFVPSMFNQFLEHLKAKGEAEVQKLKRLKQYFSSGEALTSSHVNKFNNIIASVTYAKLTNLYGPTEATVDVSYFDCFNDKQSTVVPIGKPIDNIQFFVIKEDRIKSIGEVGELCISGAGLARGYINNKELTEQKFIPNPFNGNKLMYRTGDIVRWMPDGNLEYLGREDFQVKISGLRIEIGEIENSIREFTGIIDCAVIVSKFSEAVTLIIAYLVAYDHLNLDSLKAHLKSLLPDYMIPNKFIKIKKIPLTNNGKADRKALAVSSQ